MCGSNLVDPLSTLEQTWRGWSVSHRGHFHWTLSARHVDLQFGICQRLEQTETSRSYLPLMTCCSRQWPSHWWGQGHLLSGRQSQTRSSYPLLVAVCTKYEQCRSRISLVRKLSTNTDVQIWCSSSNLRGLWDWSHGHWFVCLLFEWRWKYQSWQRAIGNGHRIRSVH